MDKIRWIKELVLAEQKMEESGMVELSSVSQDSETLLREETSEFLQQIKTAFIEAASAFNQLKGSSVGTQKFMASQRMKPTLCYLEMVLN